MDSRLDNGDSTPAGTISGSEQITDLTSLPSGILSGSQQVTDLGFISSSDSTTSLSAATSSYKQK